VIIKRTDAGANWWIVGSDALTDWGEFVSLNDTGAESSAIYFEDTAPTASVIELRNDGDASVNGNANTYIAYCFHSVEGYSKIGAFTGEGTPGAFVYTGFKPAYVLIKSYSNAGNEWFIFDNKINPYNVTSVMQYLQAQSNAAQVSTAEATPPLDFLSNGIKFRYTQFNPDGYGMLYMAFAESPFKYSNAR